MRGKARFYLLAATASLAALAGCGRNIMQFGAERQSWRHEAEVECLKSGAIKQNAGVVQISPIEGPGMCGADFPLKVAALGEATAMSYGDELRPPGAIPSSSMPRWPVNDSYYPPPPRYAAPPRDIAAPMQIAPGGGASASSGIDDYLMRSAAPPMQPAYAPRAPEYRPLYEPPRRSPQYEPQASEPEADDIPDDAILPEHRSPSRQTYAPAARPLSPPPRYEPPKLGPSRATPASAVKAAVSPPATLSCPIVSALDKWVSEGVQPAALRWFGQPVVEIKQISSYSCRGMVGGDGISEHAFGNALDIAGFTLADGRKIVVKNGWNGRPEESGFLHDVQGAACDVFTTVLAPGYNIYHYDHIHVDLMRRASGRRPCRPTAVPGEVAAARQMQKNKYAHRDPNVTGSIGGQAAKTAVAGEDGEFED
jgi:Extensin-like protein C-terminus